jgi:2-keto-4-pentenoate hydratase
MSADGPAPAWEDPRVVAGTRELLRRRELALERGEASVGWKLAFGSPEGRRSLGLAGPVLGCLTDASLVNPGATVAVGGWEHPVLEAEIGIHLGRDVAAGASPGEAAEAIAGLGPALEVANVDLPAERLADVIGAGIYLRGVVAAPAAERRPRASADDLSVTVHRHGEVCAEASDPQQLVGRPAEVVAYVADYLAAFGETLRAGELVISGSTIGHLEVEPGDSFEYSLDPIGRLAISFS